jgi:phosphotransferase system HPr-like phosphotransfer protein/DNA-binding transcriptional MerR regulator
MAQGKPLAYEYAYFAITIKEADESHVVCTITYPSLQRDGKIVIVREEKEIKGVQMAYFIKSSKRNVNLQRQVVRWFDHNYGEAMIADLRKRLTLVTDGVTQEGGRIRRPNGQSISPYGNIRSTEKIIGDFLRQLGYEVPVLELEEDAAWSPLFETLTDNSLKYKALTTRSSDGTYKNSAQLGRWAAVQYLLGNDDTHIGNLLFAVEQNQATSIRMVDWESSFALSGDDDLKEFVDTYVRLLHHASSEAGQDENINNIYDSFSKGFYEAILEIEKNSSALTKLMAEVNGNGGLVVREIPRNTKEYNIKPIPHYSIHLSPDEIIRGVQKRLKNLQKVVERPWGSTSGRGQSMGARMAQETAGFVLNEKYVIGAEHVSAILASWARKFYLSVNPKLGAKKPKFTKNVTVTVAFDGTEKTLTLGRHAESEDQFGKIDDLLDGTVDKSINVDWIVKPVLRPDDGTMRLTLSRAPAAPAPTAANGARMTQAPRGTTNEPKSLFFIQRPLDELKSDQIKTIRVDHLGPDDLKLGSTIVNLIPLLWGLRKKFPEADILVNSKYADVFRRAEQLGVNPQSGTAAGKVSFGKSDLVIEIGRNIAPEAGSGSFGTKMHIMLPSPYEFAENHAKGSGKTQAYYAKPVVYFKYPDPSVARRLEIILSKITESSEWQNSWGASLWLAGQLGLDGKIDDLDGISVSATELQFAERLLDGWFYDDRRIRLNGPILLINPYAVSRQFTLNSSDWVEVIRSLRDGLPSSPIVVASPITGHKVGRGAVVPGELQNLVVESGLEDVVIIQEPFETLAHALLGRVRESGGAVVSLDSGLSHMAGLYDLSQAFIAVETSRRSWRPPGDAVFPIVVRENYAGNHELLRTGLKPLIEKLSARAQKPVSVPAGDAVTGVDGFVGARLTAWSLPAGQSPEDLARLKGIHPQVRAMIRNFAEEVNATGAAETDLERIEFLKHLYGLGIETLVSIGSKADQGKLQIVPNLINLSLLDPTQNKAVVQNRTLRIGFSPITGNPMNWGHVIAGLRAVDQLNLDVLVLRVQGSVSNKAIAPRNDVPIMDRQRMAAASAAMFPNLVTTTDTGLNSSDIGEVGVQKIFDLNPDQKMIIYVITGTENEARAIGIADSMLASSRIVQANSKHELAWAVIPRGDGAFGAGLTEARARRLVRDRIQAEAEMETGRRPMEVRLINVDGFTTSSTDYRNTGAAAYVPRAVHQIVMQNGYYQIPRTGARMAAKFTVLNKLRAQPDGAFEGKRLSDIAKIIGVASNSLWVCLNNHPDEVKRLKVTKTTRAKIAVDMGTRERMILDLIERIKSGPIQWMNIQSFSREAGMKVQDIHAFMSSRPTLKTQVYACIEQTQIKASLSTNYYEALGVWFDATEDEIKQAFKDQHKKLKSYELSHGDERMKEVQTQIVKLKQAREALVDPQFRPHYDEVHVGMAHRKSVKALYKFLNDKSLSLDPKISKPSEVEAIAYLLKEVPSLGRASAAQKMLPYLMKLVNVQAQKQGLLPFVLTRASDATAPITDEARMLPTPQPKTSEGARMAVAPRGKAVPFRREQSAPEASSNRDLSGRGARLAARDRRAHHKWELPTNNFWAAMTGPDKTWMWSRKGFGEPGHGFRLVENASRAIQTTVSGEKPCFLFIEKWTPGIAHSLQASDPVAGIVLGSGGRDDVEQAAAYANTVILADGFRPAMLGLGMDEERMYFYDEKNRTLWMDLQSETNDLLNGYEGSDDAYKLTSKLLQHNRRLTAFFSNFILAQKFVALKGTSRIRIFRQLLKERVSLHRFASRLLTSDYFTVRSEQEAVDALKLLALLIRDLRHSHENGWFGWSREPAALQQAARHIERLWLMNPKSYYLQLAALEAIQEGRESTAPLLIRFSSPIMHPDIQKQAIAALELRLAQSDQRVRRQLLSAISASKALSEIRVWTQLLDRSATRPTKSIEVARILGVKVGSISALRAICPAGSLTFEQIAVSTFWADSRSSRRGAFETQLALLRRARQAWGVETYEAFMRRWGLAATTRLAGSGLMDRTAAVRLMAADDPAIPSDAPGDRISHIRSTVLRAQTRDDVDLLRSVLQIMIITERNFKTLFAALVDAICENPGASDELMAFLKAYFEMVSTEFRDEHLVQKQIPRILQAAGQGNYFLTSSLAESMPGTRTQSADHIHQVRDLVRKLDEDILAVRQPIFMHLRMKLHRNPGTTDPELVSRVADALAAYPRIGDAALEPLKELFTAWTDEALASFKGSEFAPAFWTDEVFASFKDPEFAPTLAEIGNVLNGTAVDPSVEAKAAANTLIELRQVIRELYGEGDPRGAETAGAGSVRRREQDIDLAITRRETFKSQLLALEPASAEAKQPRSEDATPEPPTYAEQHEGGVQNNPLGYREKYAYQLFDDPLVTQMKSDQADRRVVYLGLVKAAEKAERSGDLAQRTGILSRMTREIETDGLGSPVLTALIQALLHEPLSPLARINVLERMEAELLSVQDRYAVWYMDYPARIYEAVGAGRLREKYRSVLKDPRMSGMPENALQNRLIEGVSEGHPALPMAIAYVRRWINEAKNQYATIMLPSSRTASIPDTETAPLIITPDTFDPHRMSPLRLGFKGFNLLELRQSGFNVPSLAVLAADLPERLNVPSRQLDAWVQSPEFRRQIIFALTRLENQTGHRFPFDERHLTPFERRMLRDQRLNQPTSEEILHFSVRSGSFMSMPGAMDTALFVPFNRSIVQTKIKNRYPRWYAWDCYRRFLSSYGITVFNMDPVVFSNEIDRMKADVVSHKAIRITDFTEEQIEEVANRFERLILRELLGPETAEGAKVDSMTQAEVTRQLFERDPDGRALRISDDPFEQVLRLVAEVYDSWHDEAARLHRVSHHISDDFGTAITLQEMVFGNLSQNSGAGVLFTHDDRTLLPGIGGIFKFRSAGSELVDGTTKHGLRIQNELRIQYPNLFEAIRRLSSKVVRHEGGPREIEITVQAPDSAEAISRRSSEIGVRDWMDSIQILQTRPMTHPNLNFRNLKLAPGQKRIAEGAPVSLGASIGYVIDARGLTYEALVETLSRWKDRLIREGRQLILAYKYVTPLQALTWNAIHHQQAGSKPFIVNGMPLIGGIISPAQAESNHATQTARLLRIPYLGSLGDMWRTQLSMRFDEAGNVWIEDEKISPEDVITMDASGETGALYRGAAEWVDPDPAPHPNNPKGARLAVDERPNEAEREIRVLNTPTDAELAANLGARSSRGLHARPSAVVAAVIRYLREKGIVTFARKRSDSESDWTRIEKPIHLLMMGVDHKESVDIRLMADEPNERLERLLDELQKLLQDRSTLERINTVHQGTIDVFSINDLPEIRKQVDEIILTPAGPDSERIVRYIQPCPPFITVAEEFDPAIAADRKREADRMIEGLRQRMESGFWDRESVTDALAQSLALIEGGQDENWRMWNDLGIYSIATKTGINGYELDFRAEVFKAQSLESQETIRGVTITNPKGIHQAPSRAILQLVQAMKLYGIRLFLFVHRDSGKVTIDPTSMFSLLMPAVKQGDSIEILVRGNRQADSAVGEAAELMERLLEDSNALERGSQDDSYVRRFITIAERHNLEKPLSGEDGIAARLADVAPGGADGRVRAVKDELIKRLRALVAVKGKYGPTLQTVEVVQWLRSQAASVGGPFLVDVIALVLHENAWEELDGNVSLNNTLSQISNDLSLDWDDVIAGWEIFEITDDPNHVRAEVQFTHEQGIHLRPATAIYGAVSGLLRDEDLFESEDEGKIYLSVGDGKKCSGQSVMQMMGAAIEGGSMIAIDVVGARDRKSAQIAAEVVVRFLQEDAYLEGAGSPSNYLEKVIPQIRRELAANPGARMAKTAQTPMVFLRETAAVRSAAIQRLRIAELPLGRATSGVDVYQLSDGVGGTTRWRLRGAEVWRALDGNKSSSRTQRRFAPRDDGQARVGARNDGSWAEALNREAGTARMILERSGGSMNVKPVMIEMDVTRMMTKSGAADEAGFVKKLNEALGAIHALKLASFKFVGARDAALGLLPFAENGGPVVRLWDWADFNELKGMKKLNRPLPGLNIPFLQDADEFVPLLATAAYANLLGNAERTPDGALRDPKAAMELNAFLARLNRKQFLPANAQKISLLLGFSPDAGADAYRSVAVQCIPLENILAITLYLQTLRRKAVDLSA